MSCVTSALALCIRCNIKKGGVICSINYMICPISLAVIDYHSLNLHAVQAPHVLITGLEDYKARGTQASPYFTVSYYTEFAESKDLVLVRGDIVFTSKLTDSEAKWLLDTAQSFYLNDVRYKLVECFNRETREFEFKDVLQTLEMPIL